MDLDFLHLNYRRRIAALVWAQRIVIVAGIASVFLVPARWWGSALLFIAAFCFAALLSRIEVSLRRQFIREARLPPFLIGKLREAHPQLSRRDAELVLRGLRQFFMAHLRSGRKFVGMPSKVVDTAWHEFILHTQGYQNWCKAAQHQLGIAPAELRVGLAQLADQERRHPGLADELAAQAGFHPAQHRREGEGRQEQEPRRPPAGRNQEHRGDARHDDNALCPHQRRNAPPVVQVQEVEVHQTTTGSGSSRMPKRSYTLVWMALASVITSPPVTGLAVPPRLTSTSACFS